MYKITIKHYLNTKLKPITIYENIEAYPLYLQIIYKRKNNTIKSFTGAYMSIKAFENMQKGLFYFDETSVYNDYNFRIEEEPKILEFAIKYLDSKKIKYKINNEYFCKYLEVTTNFAHQLYSKAARTIETNICEIDSLLSCFNTDEFTLLDIANTINKIFEIDILKYLPKDYIKIWELVQKIKKETKKRQTYKTYIEYWNENISKFEDNELQKMLDRRIEMLFIKTLFD